MKGKITKVTRVSHISMDNDKIEIQLNGIDKYACYGAYDDIVRMLDKEVEFDVVMQGTEQVIANITEIHKIFKVDTRGQLPEINADITSVPDNICNFDSKLMGLICPGAIVYVAFSELGESIRAKWLDMTCLDANAKRFILRTFVPQNEEIEPLKNVIIKCTIKKNPKFSTPIAEDVEVKDIEYKGFTDAVIVSRQIVESKLETDEELKSFVDKLRLVDKLAGLCYIMPGYHLVEMAAEINYIEAIRNILKGVDKQQLIRLVFLSRAYLYADEISIKPEDNNIIIVRQVNKNLVNRDINLALTNPKDRILESKLAACWDVVRNAAKYTMAAINL